MKTELLDMLDLNKIDGLIIEAFGAGNLPKEVADKLADMITAGLPVALVSRCFNGIAEPVYAYEGGGVQLHQAGIFFVKELNAQKARIKLLIALNAGLKGQELRDYMEG
jgi:L-asparaginase, putative